MTLIKLQNQCNTPSHPLSKTTRKSKQKRLLTFGRMTLATLQDQFQIPSHPLSKTTKRKSNQKDF